MADQQAAAPAFDAELLTKLQPGFARLMPEIGARYWKAFYAAQAGCWELADWQLREMNKLFRLGTTTRPKYKDDVEEYLHEEIEPLREAIARKDFAAFERHFTEATDSANEWHRRWKKGFIAWKLPDHAPPDLDLTPPQGETP
jgi:hypothetical protein